MRHALILAGGSGTRLWPFSTAALPKQLVPLLNGRSLLDIAVQRATSCVAPDRVWLATGAHLADAVEHVDGLRADRIIIEPSGRDTLPAIALGCAVIAAHDPDAVIAVLTADHLLEPVEQFAATLEQAFALAEARDDTLVTFGVVPDHPATGFGYLQLAEPLVEAGQQVARFCEKPPVETARAFVDAGPERYLWNSGMFVWQAATLLRAVERFAPNDAHLLRILASAYRTRAWPALAAELWPQIGKVSVDYAVMEPAAAAPEFTVAALPLTCRWLDVGSWPAYGQAIGAQHDGTDERGNATSARTVLHDSERNIVASSDPDHLIALVGCEGLVVVHTPTATLVMPAEQAQQVKDLHARISRDAPDLA